MTNHSSSEATEQYDVWDDQCSEYSNNEYLFRDKGVWTNQM
jgi:hypothetical protein